MCVVVVDVLHVVLIHIVFCHARAASRCRRAAYLEMNGRFFGGRQIAASFYKEDKFDALDLEPQADEEKS